MIKEIGITPASDRFQDFLKFFFGKVYPNKDRRLRRHILKVDNPLKSDTVKIRKRIQPSTWKVLNPKSCVTCSIVIPLGKVFFFLI